MEPTSPLRVVVVATTFPGRPGDGTPEFVLTLSRALEGADVTVVAPAVPGAPLREELDGIHVRRVRYARRGAPGVADDAIMPAIRARPILALQLPALVGALLWGTLREVRSRRATVVHAHWILPAGMIALVLRIFGGPRYVLTVHGADAYTMRGAAFRWLKGLVVRGASAVAPVSADIAATLDLRDSPVLRMGVDTEAVRAAVEPRRPRPGRLLYVGRLAEKKGVDVLLAALADVPGAELVVIGDGPDRPALEQQVAALGLGDRVQLLGRQPKHVVLAQLSEAQAAVIPSRVGADGDMEGTPVVLAECMAAGVPVVASDLGGLGECIDDGRTGILVPPGDDGALAEALRSVVDGRVDLDALAKASAEEARRSLDIRAVGAAYVELLNAAAA